MYISISPASIEDWIRLHTVFLMESAAVPNDWIEFDDYEDGIITSDAIDPNVFVSTLYKDFQVVFAPEKPEMGRLSMGESTSSIDTSLESSPSSSGRYISVERTMSDISTSAPFHLVLTESTIDDEVEIGPSLGPRSVSSPSNYQGQVDGFSFLGDELSVQQGSYFSSLLHRSGSNSNLGNGSLRSDMQSSLGGIHHPADGYGGKMIPLLLSTKGPNCNELEHWILGSVFGMVPEGVTDVLPFDVRSMPIHDLVEGPNEDTGDMCHGWFSSYILGYAVTDVYTFTHRDPVPEYHKLRRLCPGSYPGPGMSSLLLRGKAPTRWGGRFFVLKQNMLLEFASREDVFNTRPVGFLTLCGAEIVPLAGNPLALSVTAMRIPMTVGKRLGITKRNSGNFIQVVLGAPNASRMNIWLITLQRAAKLKETDIYTFFNLPSNEMITTDDGNTVSLSLLDSSRGNVLAQSPFSSIHAARRPNGRCCAIKKIMTTGFFQAVANNTERFDAILREILLQGILSMKSNSKDFSPIVPVFGVFETENAVFIEMELMSNIDMFDRISRRGVSY